MDIVDHIVENRDQILTTCAKYGASNVRVFGSCARDDYDDKSDIDLLVDLKDKLDLGKLFSLQEELELLLGRKVDIGTYKMLRPRIREEILAQAIPL